MPHAKQGTTASNYGPNSLLKKSLQSLHLQDVQDVVVVKKGRKTATVKAVTAVPTAIVTKAKPSRFLQFYHLIAIVQDQLPVSDKYHRFIGYRAHQPFYKGALCFFIQ